jgi:murein DD-endopeptidase MepM/ murein hydrolase activator NlpD
MNPLIFIAGAIVASHGGEALPSTQERSTLIDWLGDASASDEPVGDPSRDAFLEGLVFEGCRLTLEATLWSVPLSLELQFGAPVAQIVTNRHLENDGQWVEYEQIPRRPDRPESYLSYRYPVFSGRVVSGYDLDLPNAAQRRGSMHAVGHGGVDLVAEMKAPIEMIRLEHQVDDAEVLYVGPLYGETIVTRHTIREGGAERDYLLVFGHLDHAARDVRRGERLDEGALVGFVGNSDSPELVHLHLEARRVREGVDARKLPGPSLNAREYSVVDDPRNVLPTSLTLEDTATCDLHPTRRDPRYRLAEALRLSLPGQP